MDYVEKKGFNGGVEEGQHRETLSITLAMKRKSIDNKLIAGLFLEQVEAL